MPSNQWTQAMTCLIVDCPIYKVPRRLRIVWQAETCWCSVHLQLELHTLQLQGVLTHKNTKYLGQHTCSRTYRYIDMNYISFVRCGELATEV